MILLRLFWEFFKTGLFAVGGGLATLPFLYEMSSKTGWFTVGDIANLVAVSESTPGPMGINMATYVGFTTAGVLGSIVGPIGLIIPSIVIIIIVSHFLNKFKENKYVQSAFYGLRPASTALIVVAMLGIVKLAYSMDSFGSIQLLSYHVNLIAVGMTVGIFILFRKLKGHPILYIIGAAIAGILFQL